MHRLHLLIRLLLLALTLLHLASWSIHAGQQLAGRDGLLIGPEEPLAGDFINLHTAGRLVIAGRVGEIYDPERFVAAEAETIPAFIGIRLWAYPPTSLPLAAPFGALPFLPALAVWSAIGLAVLAWGCKRIGLGWIETAIVVLSPAALHCIYYGQTGNLFGGLLLLALGTASAGWRGAAAGALTLKPQMGFLLPLDWLIRRDWRAIALAGAVMLGLVALSVAAWGIGPWQDYLGKSLPLLAAVEREATGQFMLMIPSLFMSARVLGAGPDLALLLHLGFALPVLAGLAWGLWRGGSITQRAVLVLIATALISPYLHSYDLAIVAAAALLLLREWPPAGARGLLLAMLVVAAWGLPNLLVTLNRGGWPVAPLLLLALFAVALWPRRQAR